MMDRHTPTGQLALAYDWLRVHTRVWLRFLHDIARGTAIETWRAPRDAIVLGLVGMAAVLVGYWLLVRVIG